MPNAQFGPRIFKNYDFLKSLAKARTDRRRCELLKKADCEELISLVEICFNILRSHFSLSTQRKKRLNPYAAYIRKLGSAKTESGVRKIIQKGGGFPFSTLLTPILLEVARNKNNE